MGESAEKGGEALHADGHLSGSRIAVTGSLATLAGAAGFIFALVKIYDVFLDPVIGVWSDGARTCGMVLCAFLEALPSASGWRTERT